MSVDERESADEVAYQKTIEELRAATREEIRNKAESCRGTDEAVTLASYCIALLAELEQAAQRLESEREARHIAEALNAEKVVEIRENWKAQVQSLSVRVDQEKEALINAATEAHKILRSLSMSADFKQVAGSPALRLRICEARDALAEALRADTGPVSVRPLDQADADA